VPCSLGETLYALFFWMAGKRTMRQGAAVAIVVLCISQSSLEAGACAHVSGFSWQGRAILPQSRATGPAKSASCASRPPHGLRRRKALKSLSSVRMSATGASDAFEKWFREGGGTGLGDTVQVHRPLRPLQTFCVRKEEVLPLGMR
jgi:hypothetical protein